MSTKKYIYVFEYDAGKPGVLTVEERFLHQTYREHLVERWKLSGGLFPPKNQIKEYDRVIGEMKRDLHKLGILKIPEKEQDLTLIYRAVADKK